MPRIQITDLQSGAELFQGKESFLTELQSVEASAIYGGKKKTGGSKTGKSSGSKMGKSSNRNSSGKSSGRHTCPVTPGGDGVVPGGD